MKISKTSWHYRLYCSAKHGDDNPTNLCTYVQTIVGHLVAMAFLGLVVVLFACCFPICLLLVLLHGYMLQRWHLFEPNFREYKPIRAFGVNMYPAHILTPLFTLWVMSRWYMLIPLYSWQEAPLSWTGITLMVVTLFGVTSYLSYFVANEALKKFPVERKDEEGVKGVVGLLYEYAKAKKARVCPIVTFVEDEG